MKRNRLLGATVAVALFGAASVHAQPAEVGQAVRPESPAQEPLDRLDAMSAAARGDWTTQVTLAARAFRENPSLVNQFNLATGYENTGRSALAIPLYQDIASRGQFVSVKAVYDPHVSPGASTRGRLLLPNLADEASRRLNAIAGRPASLAD